MLLKTEKLAVSHCISLADPIRRAALTAAAAPASAA
jgi:hypothetical protein